MKGLFLVVAVAVALCGSEARADFWGGDDLILGEILANALDQLEQLEELLGASQDNLDLIKDINRGINDSLYVLRTVGPYTDPGIYKDWRSVPDAVKKVQEIYGTVTRSRDQQVQQNTDESVAEAVTLNNSIYKYADDIDQIGEKIKDASHDVSPGGAAKLSAETLGIMLNVMNQSLRTQATGLKLQAQAIAVENRKDKEQTRHIVDMTGQLKNAMQEASPNFDLPRF